MAKERLSKFQRYTLEYMLVNGSASRVHDKAFYGKEFHESYTNSERVTVCKSYKNLKEKGLIEEVGKWGMRKLTDKGYKLLKANDCLTVGRALTLRS